MDSIAESYVRLVLAVGQHDANYVDAYYGPPEWRPDSQRPLPEIREQALGARAALEEIAPADEMSALRSRFLAKQLEALVARVRMLEGETWTFDEESAALYDVVDPGRDASYYEGVMADLESVLPGSEALSVRYDRFRSQFYVPAERMPAVFEASINAARTKTKAYIDLPSGEDFRIEYVQSEVWSAYNWYQGHSQSLIQVNTDLPLSIDRALGLACHEGYPGHHVYNALLEQRLVRERGLIEFMVYPLYSPQSLIAEGTAEYGVELSFPPEERLAFEKEVLYPLAGLDAGLASEYSEVLALVDKLGYAGNDAARMYLDGKASREETIDWLVRYSLSNPERAAQRLRFFEAHRSYIVTYDLGFDLVKAYVESLASTADEKWTVFTGLLSKPCTPSALRTA